MSKKKHRQRRPIIQFDLKLPTDENDPLIPYSIFDAHLSDAGFCMALHLYNCREHISGQYPGAELLALSMNMEPDLARSCEAELTRAGVLLLHGDGTFDMKDITDEACSV